MIRIHKTKTLLNEPTIGRIPEKNLNYLQDTKNDIKNAFVRETLINLVQATKGLVQYQSYCETHSTYEPSSVLMDAYDRLDFSKLRDILSQVQNVITPIIEELPNSNSNIFKNNIAKYRDDVRTPLMNFLTQATSDTPQILQNGVRINTTLKGQEFANNLHLITLQIDQNLQSLEELSRTFV